MPVVTSDQINGSSVAGDSTSAVVRTDVTIPQTTIPISVLIVGGAVTAIGVQSTQVDAASSAAIAVSVIGGDVYAQQHTPSEEGSDQEGLLLEEEATDRDIGDLANNIHRQSEVIPPWFGAPGSAPPVIRTILAMSGAMGTWLYGLVSYARAQTRIKTATDGWLDLIAWDFFGKRIRRRYAQSDESFRKRILTELFRPRATRPAMISVLKDLTGQTPRIFEPQRPQDTGGIGLGGGLGIGVSGAIGSLALPGQVFIDVFRSPDAGIPMAAGIGTSVGGIGVASRLVVSSLEQIRGALTDADVYSAVEATRPAGIITWVRISLGGPTSGTLSGQ